ncbi:MAG TPA: hypothetical protein VHC23_03580, partial [Jatrophihabitans sp.]|nr:hypothetical protein [Jatrophihabitans sp.]
MSPSEKDLRAALRHGEGDGLDVGQIIQRGQQARARRRTQLLSGASAAVLVAGIGAGAWALGRAGGGTSSAGGSS